VNEAVPRIGLLASQQAKRKLLSEVLTEFGYEVVYSGDPVRLDTAELAGIAADAWLLELAEDSPLTDWLLESSTAPMLFGAGEIPDPRSEDYPRWQRRLYNKLLPLLGRPPGANLELAPVLALGSSPGRPEARCVWLLGASLGGPAAVKAFLDKMSADLPIAFVYAQHIDAGFEGQLPDILGRHNDWRILNARDGVRLREGDVLVASIGQAMGFGPDGDVRLLDEPWPGPYQPAIGELLDRLARQFAPACGAIIFSGMGEDGVAACGRMRGRGMQVWTQQAGSAVCATMPEAVRLAGHSTLQGTPEQLARALRRWLEREWPVAL
jgi:chemosensory pili system protein ChpB (putative protein-glutamate methylesterase)